MFTKTASSKFHIIVLDRGHVLVGEIAARDESGLSVKNASIIRLWGTTKGLGQLCLEGRQEKTVTDLIGVVQVPTSSIIFVAEAPAWTQ